MTTNNIAVTEAYEQGEAAKLAGESRLVPRDILVEQGVEAARAWYKGWDTANLRPEPGVCIICGGPTVYVSGICRWCQEV